jgi:hypothetical protein
MHHPKSKAPIYSKLAFANKVRVLLACPFSHVRTACYRELSVWDFAIFCLLHATRNAPWAICARHTRALLSQRLRRHVSFMYSRALRSFSRFSLARDGCAAPIDTHTPTPITCADCPNEYQFGSRPVQPFGRQRWICSLSVYARLCTHTRTRTWAHARAHTHTVISRYSTQPC